MDEYHVRHITGATRAALWGPLVGGVTRIVARGTVVCLGLAERLHLLSEMSVHVPFPMILFSTRPKISFDPIYGHEVLL